MLDRSCWIGTVQNRAVLDPYHPHHATNSRQSTCSLCSGVHFIIHCQEFRTKTPEQRKVVVSNKNLCFNCLGSHRLSECKSSKRCLHCSGQHHTLFHMPTSTLGASSSNTATIMEESLTPRTLKRAFVSQQATVSSTTVYATALVHVHDHQG